MKQKIIKTITLLTFVGLLAAFVTYRAGMLDTSLQLSPNGGTINSTGEPDSVGKNNLMPSSKSMQLMDEDFISTDSQEIDSIYWEDIEIMNGSKSGIMFEPEIPVDSSDSKTKKRKKK